MTDPLPKGPRESVSILLPALEALLLRKGRIGSEEACRLLLSASTIPSHLAPRLLAAAVAHDRRFQILEDGSVRLAPPPPCLSAPLAELAFTVVDLETTGGSHAQDRVLEVGAVRVESLRPGGEFSTLVNPGVPIPAFITSMTGIRQEMIADAPRFGEIAEELASFLGDTVLVAHNLPFDWGFLNRELARHGGFMLANRRLCTVRIGRRLLAHLSDRRLDTVAAHYGISIESRHRALGDARATAGVLIKLVEALAEMGIRTLAELEEYLAGRVPARREGRTSESRSRSRREPPPASA